MPPPADPPKLLEQLKPIPAAAPEKAKGGRSPAQGRTPVSDDWRALLIALGFPASDSWTPPRDKRRGAFILRPRDNREFAGLRFWAWLQAVGETGEVTPERLRELYAECANRDYRTPWADRIVLNELRTSVHGKWVKSSGAPVTWTIIPVALDKVRELLMRRKVPMTEMAGPPAIPTSVPAVPAAEEEPKQVAAGGGRLANLIPFRRVAKADDHEPDTTIH
jgi:hypothetical protein